MAPFISLIELAAEDNLSTAEDFPYLRIIVFTALSLIAWIISAVLSNQAKHRNNGRLQLLPVFMAMFVLTGVIILGPHIIMEYSSKSNIPIIMLPAIILVSAILALGCTRLLVERSPLELATFFNLTTAFSTMSWACISLMLHHRFNLWPLWLALLITAFCVLTYVAEYIFFYNGLKKEKDSLKRLLNNPFFSFSKDKNSDDQ